MIGTAAGSHEALTWTVRLCATDRRRPSEGGGWSCPMEAPASEETPVASPGGSQLFVRQSTGLVREASALDATIFNAVFSAPVGATLAWGVFCGPDPSSRGPTSWWRRSSRSSSTSRSCIMMALLASSMPQDGRRLRVGQPHPVAAPGAHLELRGRALGHDRRHLLGALLPGLRARPDPGLPGHLLQQLDADRLGQQLPEGQPVDLRRRDGHGRPDGRRSWSPGCGRRSAGRTPSGSSPRSGRSSPSSSCCSARRRTSRPTSTRSTRSTAAARRTARDRGGQRHGSPTERWRPRRRRCRPSSSIMTFMMWNWWSVYLSGELKSASNRGRQLSIMFGALVWDVIFIVVGAAPPVQGHRLRLHGGGQHGRQRRLRHPDRRPGTTSSPRWSTTSRS